MFLFEKFDFLLYTSLEDIYILNPPKCQAACEASYMRESFAYRFLSLAYPFAQLNSYAVNTSQWRSGFFGQYCI